MNWDMISREDRLFKGKELYRWDDSPGLEHHCGVCAKPLHNDRIKNSCLGIHMEPCFRYHQQLHFIGKSYSNPYVHFFALLAAGKSHECFGCNSSDELHHCRHKDILTLIRELENLDEAKKASIAAYGKRKDSADSARDDCPSLTAGSSMADSNSEIADEKLTRRQRKNAKKSGALGGGIASKAMEMEIFRQGEVDFISEAIHLRITESKGAWEGMYIYKSEASTPTAKVRSPFIEAKNKEEDEDEDEAEHAVHTPGSSGQMSRFTPPNFPTPKQLRMARRAGNAIDTYQHLPKVHRGGSKKYTATKDQELLRGLDPKIFERLGVDLDGGGKARKDMVKKLIESIKNDLDICAREDDEINVRQEGFSRWAGKTALQNMNRIREELDWATGQRKFSGREGLGRQESTKATVIDEVEPDEPPQDPTPTRAKLKKPAKVIADGDKRAVRVLKIIAEENPRVNKQDMLKIGQSPKSTKPKPKTKANLRNAPIPKTTPWKSVFTENFDAPSMQPGVSEGEKLTLSPSTSEGNMQSEAPTKQVFPQYEVEAEQFDDRGVWTEIGRKGKKTTGRSNGHKLVGMPSGGYHY